MTDPEKNNCFVFLYSILNKGQKFNKQISDDHISFRLVLSQVSSLKKNSLILCIIT